MLVKGVRLVALLYWDYSVYRSLRKYFLLENILILNELQLTFVVSNGFESSIYARVTI